MQGIRSVSTFSILMLIFILCGSTAHPHNTETVTHVSNDDNVVLPAHKGRHENVPAKVRMSRELAEDEKAFLRTRTAHVQRACEHLLKQKLHPRHVPVIAFCFSGGGCRAMVETLGSLSGAHDTGILDTATYAGGLSGSTWALTPWVLSGLNIHDHLNSLSSKLNSSFAGHFSGFLISKGRMLYAHMRQKNSNDQHFGLVNLYGALLAHILLEDRHQNASLTDLAPQLARGTFPLPVCTAVAGGADNHHLWFEFTPYEVGCAEMGFIPTWAFGRKFSKGVSLEMTSGTYASAQNLAYCLGIWGSAFAVDAARIKHEFKSGNLEPFQYALRCCENIHGYVPINGYLTVENMHYLMSSVWPDPNHNFAAAQVPNFVHEVSRDGWWNWLSGTTSIPLAQHNSLSLIDGGFDLVDGSSMNLGIIPLLRPERKVDIIIICDSSADLKGAPSLYAAEKRARALGLKFPRIDYTKIDEKIISVFDDPQDPKTPTIIYMPGIKNPSYGSFDPTTVDYTNTMNFYYTPVQVRELSGLTAYNMQQSRDALVDALVAVVNKKRIQRRWW